MKPAAPGPQDKFRVLVIEDDFDVARLLCRTLEAVNMECFHEADGASGLIAFGINDPHLVLLDLMLPGQNGNDVCQEIRRMSTAPIVMTTALGEEDTQLQAFRTGADDFVLKPFNMKLLVARILANLRRAYRYDACESCDPEPQDHSIAAMITPSGASSATATTATTTAPAQSSGAPSGWATCDRCGYMGPRSKFDYENALGNKSARCPVCRESDHIVFTL